MEVDIKSYQFVCYGEGVANVSEYPPVEGGVGIVGRAPWKGGVLGCVVLGLLMALL